MQVLFDQGALVPLRSFLSDHEVTTAYERGWSNLRNGELLQEAESDGFEVFVTTDQNRQYQQNIHDRVLAIVVLTITSWPRIQKASTHVVATVNDARPGQFSVVRVP